MDDAALIVATAVAAVIAVVAAAMAVAHRRLARHHRITLAELSARIGAEQERDAAALSVAESEEKYRRLFEEATDPIGQLDLDERFMAVNPALCRMLGYELHELIGRHITDFLVPDDRIAIVAETRAKLAGLKETSIYEQQLVRRNGTIVRVEVSSRLISNGGVPVGTQGICRDITTRAAVEQALRESERRYRTLVSSTLDGVFTLDLEERFVDSNPTFAGMLGYRPEEVIGRTVFDLTPEREHVRAAKNTAAKLAGRATTSTFEAEHVAKDGNIVTLEISTQLIRSDNDEPLYILGIARDVTARRAAEAAIAASERRYRELFENATDGISICGLDGRLIDVNRTWERSTGYTLAEVEGQSLWTLLPPESAAIAHAAQDELLAAEPGGASVSYETEFVKPDGTRRLFEVVHRVIRDDRSAIAIERISRDVTDRRDLEERLRQSQRLEAVGQLAGGIAHDFNNLLTVIGGNAGNALLSLADDEPARDDLGEILQASHRAAQLTQQLLAFSRKQLLQPRVIDLNEVVAGIETMLARLIGETITFRTVLADGLPRVRADRGQIEQAVVNLVVNARDALPSGGTITVSTAAAEVAAGHPEIEPGSYATITVADDGEGMTPEVRARIFEPFFTTKPAGRGTGLGLSTVLGVVTQSGGQIEAETALGAGSTFRLYLPVVAAADDGGRAEAPAPASVQGGRGESVLVVEDDPQVRRVIGRILRDQGYAVTEAEDAHAALRLVEAAATPVQLVVSDVVMPGMSGLDLAEALAGSAPGLPVLLLTGYTEDAELLADTERSQRRVLKKPVTPAELSATVREALDEGARPARA